MSLETAALETALRTAPRQEAISGPVSARAAPPEIPGPSRHRSPLWLWYAGLGAVAILAYWFAPDGIPEDIIYAALGASCLVAIATGVRRHAPGRRAAWLLMLVGLSFWVVGDGVSSWYQDIAHNDAYPSWADACYLAAYPILAIALLLLIRGRMPRRDVGGLLDSAILAIGLAILSWVMLGRPTIDAAGSSFAAAAVGIAYPAADIFLVGMLIRLITTPGGRTPAFRLLMGAVTLLVAGDTTSAALGLWTSTNTAIYDVIWLTSYVVWGTAALHPSMATLSEPSQGEAGGFTRRRLVSLALAGLIAPGIMIVQKIVGVPIDTWAMAAGWVLLFLLVVARMNVAISQAVAANRERERLQVDLAHQAAHDSLTDLPNRARAMSGIEAALLRAQRSGAILGLLFIDLDGFKAVNDTLGHRAGDAVLRVIADRLRAAIRGGDLVARLGGDEFVVLLESVGTESDSVLVAERLMGTIALPILLADGRQARVGASMGLAISQDGSTNADHLLHDADTAAYRAKAAGRGRVEVFDDVLRSELQARADLVAALGRAIATDELVLHYQPIVDLASNEVRGYEALVRWARPGHGLIPPIVFIPTAETSSLICDLDTWVLHEAAAQLVSWHQPGMTVAVNISGRHVSEPRILDDVRSALTTTGLPPSQLVLEITETVLIEDLHAARHLSELRDLGVAVSLDDFGTGYNSLPRIRELPVDSIKIDRSFLDTAEPSSRALLELMINAAHTFGLPVIAEGVETIEQLHELRSMNCESGQGYFLSRPLTVEQITLGQVGGPLGNLAVAATKG